MGPPWRENEVLSDRPTTVDRACRLEALGPSPAWADSETWKRSADGPWPETAPNSPRRNPASRTGRIGQSKQAQRSERTSVAATSRPPPLGRCLADNGKNRLPISRREGRPSVDQESKGRIVRCRGFRCIVWAGIWAGLVGNVRIPRGKRLLFDSPRGYLRPGNDFGHVGPLAFLGHVPSAVTDRGDTARNGSARNRDTGNKDTARNRDTACNRG